MMSSERGGVVEAALSASAALSGCLGRRRRIHGNPAAKQSQVLFACFSASSSSEARRKAPRIDEDGKRRRRRDGGVDGVGERAPPSLLRLLLRILPVGHRKYDVRIEEVEERRRRRGNGVGGVVRLRRRGGGVGSDRLENGSRQRVLSVLIEIRWSGVFDYKPNIRSRLRRGVQVSPASSQPCKKTTRQRPNEKNSPGTYG